MSPSLKYVMTGVAAIAMVVAGSWPLLDPAARRGVLLAAAVALPVQVVAFAALHRFRLELNAFLAAWIGGTFLRMAVIGAVAFAVIRSGMQGAVAMLLALVGFFLGLLLLEPVFFRAGSGTPAEHDMVEA